MSAGFGLSKGGGVFYFFQVHTISTASTPVFNWDNETKKRLAAIDLMPPDAYHEYRRVLQELSAQKRISEQYLKATAIAVVCGILVSAFLYCRAFVDPSWKLDPQDSDVVRVVPHFFAPTESYKYRWGTDLDNNTGWLPLDGAGHYHGQHVLAYPDANPSGEANVPMP